MSTSIATFSWTANKSNTWNLLYSRTWVCVWYHRSVLTAAGKIHQEQAVSGLSGRGVIVSMLLCLPSSNFILFKYLLLSPSVVPVSCLYQVLPLPSLPSDFLFSLHLFCLLPLHHYLLFLRNFSETFKQLKFPGFTLAGAVALSRYWLDLHVSVQAMRLQLSPSSSVWDQKVCSRCRGGT